MDKNIEKTEFIEHKDAEERPPLTDYYEVINWETIRKYGAWWSVIALMRDNKHKKNFILLVKYNKVKQPDGNKVWKRRLYFKINSLQQSEIIMKLIDQFSEHWVALEETEL